MIIKQQRFVTTEDTQPPHWSQRKGPDTRSYRQHRQQVVQVPGATSEMLELAFGVPQGSVLGPILFTAYTKPHSDVMVGSDVYHHMYADDGQLHITFNPRQPSSRDSAIGWVEQCVAEVKTWMDSHFMKMNSSKTEMLIITTPQVLRRMWRERNPECPRAQPRSDPGLCADQHWQERSIPPP